MDRREAEEIGIAVGLLTLAMLGIAAYKAAEDIAGSIPVPGNPFGGSSGTILVVAALVLSALVGLTLAALAVRFGMGHGIRTVGFLYGLYGRITPDSAIGTAVLTFTLTIVLLAVVVGLVPTLMGNLSESASVAEQLDEAKLNSDWDHVTNDDTLARSAACGDARTDPRDDDADRDGIPDEWEREGRVPGGPSLPNADPQRKDVYVQVNHGSDVTPFTRDELGELERLWAAMPVSNPDGSSGIDLHLDVDSERAGALDGPATVNSSNEAEDFYTEKALGDRRCIYHQVTLADINVGNKVGFAAQPGFFVVVDGTQRNVYEGNVSLRTAMTTHQLLHNLAGRVAGNDHTAQGWRKGGPDNEFLSEATREELESGGFIPVADRGG